MPCRWPWPPVRCCVAGRGRRCSCDVRLPVNPQVTTVDTERAAAPRLRSEHPSKLVVRVARALQVSVMHPLLVVLIARGHDVRRIVAPAMGAELDVVTVHVASPRARGHATAELVTFEDTPELRLLLRIDLLPGVDRLSDQGHEGSPRGKRAHTLSDVVEEVVQVFDHRIGSPKGDPAVVSVEVQ